MPRTEPLPEFEDRAPPDRFCDLILTGGVTSAIAYPGAIFALASFYRFNSIGGSSSGGGAAALAAAAEYRRRRGSSEGFRLLARKTDDLANPVDGKTGLEWLFQPGKQHRRIFTALVPGVAAPTGKFGKLIGGFAKAYWFWFALGVVLALVPVRLATDHVSGLALVAFCAWGLLLGPLFMVLVLAYDLKRVMDYDFGMCSGIDKVDGAPRKPLTVWLHELIQDIADKPHDAPLTFEDLAKAPGSPREVLSDYAATGGSAITLKMFTANITHARPYLLPQEADDPQANPQLYFRPCEMLKLFPAEVVAHMKKHSSPCKDATPVVLPASARPKGAHWSPAVASALAVDDALWTLPREQLPIVVAARMSVSFPVLFTAVPMWTLDTTTEPHCFRRCLFSDGGLCANFPIHLFDSPVPAWPTFGIALHEVPWSPKMNSQGEVCCADAMKDAISLPNDHRDGVRDRWNGFEYEEGALGRLLGFVAAVVGTMKDWNDATLSRLPGVRDRVVNVGLRPGIGGLNILMTESMIRCLGETGVEAAKTLLARFSKGSAPGGMAQGWNEHRWVRFNVLERCLAETLKGLGWAASQNRHAKPLREQIRDAGDEGPLIERNTAQGQATPTCQLRPGQAAVLEGVLDVLLEAERALNGTRGEQPYMPSPRPNFRIRPPM